MNYKNLCIVNGVVFLLFGLPLLLAPSFMADIYSKEAGEFTSIGEALGRLYGASLVAVGVAMLFSTKAQPSYARRGLLVLLTIFGILTAIIHIYLILSGIENAISWSTVAIIVFLNVWAVMLLSKEKKLLES